MRIQGTKFSDNYDRLLELNKQLPDEIEDHLLEWSRDVVNVLTELEKEASFKVTIELVPNTSNIKGVDQVTIQVWKTAHEGWQGFRTFAKISAFTHTTIGDAIKEINTWMNNLTERLDNPDVVERDGKKYRLVEVK